MSKYSKKECSRIILHEWTFFLQGAFWLFIMSFTSLKKTSKKFSSFDETLITVGLSTTSLSAEILIRLTNLTTQKITFCKEKICILDNTAEQESETGKRTKTTLPVVPYQVQEGPTKLRESGKTGQV